MALKINSCREHITRKYGIWFFLPLPLRCIWDCNPYMTAVIGGKTGKTPVLPRFYQSKHKCVGSGVGAAMKLACLKLVTGGFIDNLLTLPPASCQCSFWMVPIEMKHNGHYCQKCRDNQLITSSSHVFHESWIYEFFSRNFMFNFERAAKCLFLLCETVIASFLNPIENFYLV